jgi:hypothetical protein
MSNSFNAKSLKSLLALAIVAGSLVAISNSAYAGVQIAPLSALNQNWRAITSSSDGTHLAAVVTNGDIWTSADSGVSWIDRTGAGTQVWISIASSSNGSKLAAGVSSGDIYTSNDFGATWTDRVASGIQL